MRILRVLRSRTLECGCLVGVYESYDGRVAEIVDARDDRCTNPRHRLGRNPQGAVARAQRGSELTTAA